MTIYLDTSLLVAAMAPETGTAAAMAWMTDHAEVSLVISDWVIAEFASAIAVKQRRGDIDADDARAAQAQFAALVSTVFEVVMVTRPHFRAAARIAETSAAGLRAGDALHLAIAADLGLSVATLDRGMARAAAEAGVRIA